MKRFKNKYRIPSARFPNYDYSKNGDYFITICTSRRMQYFGKIINEEMILNDMGLLVDNLISKIIDKFKDIRIVEHIIMPDHVHLIIKIYKPEIDSNVETRLVASLQPINENQNNSKGGITGNNNPMFKDGISKIVRWFKGRATFELRKIDKEFAWQTRFYDRIIRNKEEYFAMIQYIKSNPKKGDNDL